MAAELYDATRDGVLVYLQPWRVIGDVLPGYDEIDTDGKFLPLAATDVGLAMQRAGHGISPVLEEGGATRIHITSLIEERAALYFAGAIAGMMDQDALNGAWGRNNRKLEDIKAGYDMGELDSDTNQANGQFKHAGETRAQLDARRSSASRVM